VDYNGVIGLTGFVPAGDPVFDSDSQFGLAVCPRRSLRRITVVAVSRGESAYDIRRRFIFGSLDCEKPTSRMSIADLRRIFVASRMND
jgi:hypothetical protein